MLLVADTLIPAAFFFLFRNRAECADNPGKNRQQHKCLNVLFHVIGVFELLVFPFITIGALASGANKVALWCLLLIELTVMISLVVWLAESRRGLLDAFSGKRIIDIQLWALLLTVLAAFFLLFFHFQLNLRKLGIVLSLTIILFSFCDTNFKSTNSEWRFAQLGTCIVVAFMLFVTLNLLLDHSPYERHWYQVIETGGYHHGIVCRMDDGSLFNDRSSSAHIGDRGIVYVCEGWFQETYYCYDP